MRIRTVTTRLAVLAAVALSTTACWGDRSLRFTMPPYDYRVTGLDVEHTHGVTTTAAVEVDVVNLRRLPTSELLIEADIQFQDASLLVIERQSAQVRAAPTGSEPPPARFEDDFPPGVERQLWDNVSVVVAEIPDGAMFMTISAFADPPTDPYVRENTDELYDVVNDDPNYLMFGNVWETPTEFHRERGLNPSEMNNGLRQLFVWRESGDGGDGVWRTGEAGDWRPMGPPMPLISFYYY